MDTCIKSIPFGFALLYEPRSQNKAQDSVDPGDAPALLFDQCCFCPDKKLPKRAGSLKDRGFYSWPDPPYPVHMKIVVTQGAADVWWV